jgi:nuclear pore complex protein Nup93
LSDSAEYLRKVVLAAADQSSSDSSLLDSIELYHLAGASNKVIESVNRALGGSLSQSSSPLNSQAEALGLSGAFGGASDLVSLAQRVMGVYEKDFGRRTKVEKKAWETLRTLLVLKTAMGQWSTGRADLALEVSQIYGARGVDG